MASSGGDVGAIADLQASVKKLYNIRDKFFSNNAIDKAGEKRAAIAAAKAESLAIVKNLSENHNLVGTAEFAFLEGKTHNASEDYDQAAEVSLSKAVKLNPKHVDAWNQLGECFWKKKDLPQAKTCFDSALKVNENKDSLRSLSMLLRQLNGDDLARKANIVESLELAKRAIKLDVTDGHSWFVLGNAYLALFFASMDTVEHVRQALKAYRRAESDKVEGTNNPDLHQNRATIHKYQEDYGLAIEGFQLASWLDPEWSQPKTALTALQDLLERIASQIEKKGGFKQKKIAGVQAALASEGDPSAFTALGDLKEGVNDLKTVRVTIMTVFTEETLPQTFLAIDADGTWVCITVYNMDLGTLAVDDTVEIPEPYLRRVKVATVPVAGAGNSANNIEYLSIRVDNPVTLKKGGRPLGESKLVKAQMTITAIGE